MLEYLSDDEIYGRAERRARKASRKSKRATRKAQRRARKGTPRGKARRQRRRSDRASRKSSHRTRTGRKQTRKSRRQAEGRPSRIARIGLAPARGAFHTAVRMNVGKLATKLVRVYGKQGGKKKLEEFWRKFGGKWKSLSKSMSKGAKASISNDEFIGEPVTFAAVAAVAAPIMIAAAALIKTMKAGGSKGEMEELDEVIEYGKEELATNPEYDNQGTAYMDNQDVAVMQRGAGDEEYDDDDDFPTMGSFFSLGGLLFKSLFMLSVMTIENPVLLFLSSILVSYCILGVLLLPFHLAGKNWVWFYYKPVNFLLYGFTKMVKSGA